MPVHLFGRPAPLAELASLGPPLIEDAAQAFGSPEIAGVGVASTFSFYPTKNLFGLGDGGLVAVNDGELAERIRMLRFHGSRRSASSSTSGRTRGWTRSRRLRCGSSSASSTAGQHFAARRPSATAASASASSVRFPRTSPGTSTTCSSLARRSGTRSAQLTEAGIGSADYYEPPLHLQPALRYLGYSEGDLPETERAARENFSVPLWAGITAEQQERVVDTVRAALGVPA